MARSNGSVALAGVLICFASLVVSVNGGGGLADSGELIQETVIAWNPLQTTAAPTAAPIAAPTAAPTAAPPLSTGTGTCPENATKNFWNMFNIRTNKEHVIVSEDGDAAQMQLDAISGRDPMPHVVMFVNIVTFSEN